MNEADPERLKDHASGSLIGTFVGDALGMPVEGWPADRIKQRHGRVDEMLDARLGAGTYTDDTQMMIALARSMVRSEGIDRQVLARSFLDHYDPNRGYGRGTRRVMNLWEGVDPAEASNRIFDGGSFGNGASMRTAPLGLVYGPEPDRFREPVGYWTKRYESIRDLLNEGTPVNPATAAGTLGCSSVSGESVPDRWFENLETGEDGRDTVVELGRSLVEMFFYPSD